MKKILLILITLSSLSFIANDNLIFDNYFRSVTNVGSTIQFFSVINVKEGNSENYREVCVTGFEIYHLIATQESIDWDDFKKITKKAKKNRQRNFSITDPDLLSRINRIKYSQVELKQYAQVINIDSIVKSIAKNSDWKYYAKTNIEQVMIAHLLFNNGIMLATNECLGGDDLFLSDGY